jgi:CBS domain-containing protein
VNQLSEILEEKGHHVLEIEADASVFEAVKQMVEANIGSLLVTEGGKITGIVTERDYLRRVTLHDRTDRLRAPSVLHRAQSVKLVKTVRCEPAWLRVSGSGRW